MRVLPLVFVLMFACAAKAGAADLIDLNINNHIKVRNPHTLVAPSWLKNRPVYMDILNTSNREDVLTGASSPVAQEIVLQYTHDYGEGVKTMRPLEGQEILLPPRSRVRLRPGGMHLMLTGLKRPLPLAMEIPIKLEFRDSTPIYIRATIQKQPE